MSFGDFLKDLINKKGYSYRKLGLLSDVDHTYISKIVRNEVPPPSPEILERLAPHLNVPYDLLMLEAGYLTKQEYTEDEIILTAKDLPLDAIKHFRGLKNFTPEKKKQFIKTFISTVKYIEELEKEDD